MSADGSADQIDVPGKAELIVGGRRFVVGCAPGQEARLKALGQRFDTRVRELIEAMGDLGPERLFLMASLSLLDEVEGQAASTLPTPADPAPPAFDREAFLAAHAEALSQAEQAAADRTAAIERRAASALSDAASRISGLTRRIEGFE